MAPIVGNATLLSPRVWEVAGVEEKVRDLCVRLLAADAPEEFHALADELRDALHEHIEDMRERASQLALANQLLLLLKSSDELA